MSSNPYSDAINRYFKITMGVLGGLVGLGVAAHAVFTGHVPELGRRSIGPGYFETASPSQFWFSVLFYGAFGLGSLYVAWRAYRS